MSRSNRAPQVFFPPIRLEPGETPARAVAVADGNTCVLLADQSVWCWGRTAIGGLDAFPRQIPIDGVTGIDGADGRMYAVTSRGELYFWGTENWDLTDMPRQLEDSGVAEVSASRTQTCIRKVSGDVICWAQTKFEQRRQVMSNAVRISVGTRQACGLDESKTVSCWSGAGVPQKRAENTSQVAVGGEYGCALLTGGLVRCWKEDGTVWQVPELSGVDVAALRAGNNSICAWSSGGAPRCIVVDTGEHPSNRLPEASIANRFRSVSDVRVGPLHGCAVTDGAVVCWGTGSSEALGPRGRDGLDHTRDPVRVRLGNTAVLRGARAIAVAPGRHCLITTQDELYCWGFSGVGELGTGDEGPNGPTPVPGIGPVSAVALGPFTTCALGRDEAVYCFGFMPAATELEPCPPWPERPNPRCARSPVKVASGMQGVTVGSNHVCMLTKAGEVKCFGENSSGQLGNGSKASSFEPVTVLAGPGRPLEGIVAIRAAEAHTCALDRKGKVQCWGENEPGSQGRPYKSPGIFRYATQPFEVGRVTALADRCVRLESGELRCWNETNHYRPARIGICGTTLVAGGGPGTCRLDVGGRLTCGEFYAPFGPDGGWKGINIRANTGMLRALDAHGNEVCAIDSNGRVSCWRYDTHLLPVIGTTPAWLEEASVDRSCAVDPAEKQTARFPPEPFSKAYVRKYVSPETAGQVARDETALTPAQTARLIALLNDPSSFEDAISACPAPSHEYVLRDGAGAIVARIVVGLAPTTLSERPRSPAHKKGDMLTEKATEELRKLCRETGIEACGEQPCSGR